ncbi:MAG: hypothetical protein R3195_05340 [Gemmatimonadota bacterium]|nr:hypothetical protein [Gemmatimonadota bacterium]
MSRRGQSGFESAAWCAAAALLAGLTAACSDEGVRGETFVRDTLPDGTVVLRYPSLPIGEPLTTTPDLRIGSVDDDPNTAFGDVRGVDAASDGTIFVLDYQAAEVRAFGPDGAYLRTVVTEGEGPGEIREANGFKLVGDSILWIQDHGQWQMIGVSPEGDEVERYPMPIRRYGYMWSGTIDDRGRLWRTVGHVDEEPTFPPEPGLREYTSRGYVKWYDPSSESSDSIFLGEENGRTHISRNSAGGSTHRGIPHDPSAASVVDPAGGFWRAWTDAYRVARLDETGDTVFVIESAVEPLLVTGDDRSGYVEAGLEYDDGARAALEEVAALMPETKPVIEGLTVDDMGRLWVRRTVPTAEMPLFDVFDRQGMYQGSVRFGFEPNAYLPMRFEGGNLYTFVRDELDIQYVVRAPVPEGLGAVEALESAGR